MNAWWAGLAPRERVILIVGMLVLALLLIWLAIIEPLANRRASLHSEVATLSADHDWMQQVATEVRRRAAAQSGSGARAPAGNGSVLTLVEVSANASGMRTSMERIQPEGQGARIWFDSVSFDALMRWLAELEKRQGLQISQLAVDAGSEPGQVSARVLVESR
ncbi:type II secretion system protein GspM [Halopseudomonas pelagia]|uniref:type II secretion system protein GspM n=1 Tax=Halopseudomonas pelagia TaxID=553151 RepID=UPI00039F0CC9|nr:type II secretion system protein M [Halopseudomonas pelagia]|tara:strand:- start:1070 stop:1558 length:489 start_codon:yes stop_codon:yes gene_type:complete